MTEHASTPPNAGTAPKTVTAVTTTTATKTGATVKDGPIVKTGTVMKTGASGLVRAVLLCALTAGALSLAAPAHAYASAHARPAHAFASAPALAPAKRCPTGAYWEPHNRACVPMSRPLARH